MSAIGLEFRRTMTMAAVALLSSATVMLAISLAREPRAPIQPLKVDDLARALLDCSERSGGPRGSYVATCEQAAQNLTRRLLKRTNRFDPRPRTSHFNVYLLKDSVVYFQPRCSPLRKEEDEISLNIWARDRAVVPPDRQKAGFVIDDFLLSRSLYRQNETCVAVRPLPSWAIARLVSGRFDKSRRAMSWHVDITVKK